MAAPSGPDIDAINELVAITKLFAEDLTKMRRYLKPDSTRAQFWRRMYVRTFFAEVEAIAYQLKQMALHIWGRNKVELAGAGIELTDADIAQLNEDEYMPAHEGEPAVRTKRLDFKENLKFAFSWFTMINRAQFTLQVQSPGWNSFLRALQIRDRLTHPKSVADLTITDAELAIIEKGVQWFVTEMHYCLVASSAVYARKRSIKVHIEVEYYADPHQSPTADEPSD